MANLAILLSLTIDLYIEVYCVKYYRSVLYTYTSVVVHAFKPIFLSNYCIIICSKSGICDAQNSTKLH